MTVTAAVPATAPPPGPPPGAARAARRRPPPALAIAVLFLGLVLLALLVPGLLATHGPTALDYTAALRPPSPAHWFGTDESGRDLYSRVVFGARPSLVIGLGAAGLALVLAVVLGGLAALGSRLVAGVVGRVIEVVFAFPTLLLALLLVAVLGPSALTQVVAVGVGTSPGYARMVRAQILSVKGAGYVEAAVALGHPARRILLRQVLPNAFRPLIAVFTLAVGQSIVWASSLAFLGLGVAPPASEWGALLDAGRQYVVRAPWLIVVPGAVIVVLALAATVVGRHVQAALEKGDR
jgi:peptide/nickel transport system permease protein